MLGHGDGGIVVCMLGPEPCSHASFLAHDNCASLWITPWAGLIYCIVHTLPIPTQPVTRFKERQMSSSHVCPVNKCVVKMSQPHIHRKNGPMFKLGDEIVEACSLTPASYDAVEQRVRRKRPHPDSDVEPSDSDSESDHISDRELQCDRNKEYRSKKIMSSAVFRYFMNATNVQQAAMQVEVSPDVQQLWNNCTTVRKFDDLGDALLHALDEILCSGSNYRQLLPPITALEANRTVVVLVLPDKICWTTTECLHNQITIQDFGVRDLDLDRGNYSDDRTVNTIHASLPENLYFALNKFESHYCVLNSTKYIKVVVKQLKQNTAQKLSGKAAGALTNATVKAMTTTCDRLLPSGTLRVENNKQAGWSYSRKCDSSGQQFVVMRSSGKQLNAILSCPQYMKSNMPNFVRDRPLRISKDDMASFFEALRQIALTTTDFNSAHLESIRLSSRVIERLKFFEGMSSSFVKNILADLILIALNNNQQYIRGISDNYRRPFHQ